MKTPKHTHTHTHTHHQRTHLTKKYLPQNIIKSYIHQKLKKEVLTLTVPAEPRRLGIGSTPSTRDILAGIYLLLLSTVFPEPSMHPSIYPCERSAEEHREVAADVVRLTKRFDADRHVLAASLQPVHANIY